MSENNELREHIGILANSFVFSENFGPYFLYGGLPSQAQFWNALRGWDLTRILAETCSEDNDEALKLRHQIRKLKEVFDLSELGWIALHMSLADRQIEEVILKYIREGLPDWSKRQLFEAILEKGEGEALMRIAEIANGFFSRHPLELERLKGIARNKISLKEISNEQVAGFVHAVKALYGVTSHSLREGSGTFK